MQRQEGFTLIELMIAMAIFAVVIAGVYLTYASQQKSYMNQEQVATMQQNVRAAMTLIERDLRLAGYYDRANPPAKLPGIEEAKHNTFTVTYDIDGDGVYSGTTETIIYSLAGGNLLRNGGILAENIDGFDCVYGSGVSAVMNENGGDVAAADWGSIVAVEITIVARSTQIDREYVNQITYQNQQGVDILNPSPNPPLDNFRRRILSMRTHCRNLWYRV